MTKYYFATWRETRREAVNRFGRLGYVVYDCAGVLEVEDGKKTGKVWYSPTKSRGADIRLSTLASIRELNSKPRANSRVWKDCNDGEQVETTCQFARASEMRRYGRKRY